MEMSVFLSTYDITRLLVILKTIKHNLFIKKSIAKTLSRNHNLFTQDSLQKQVMGVGDMKLLTTRSLDYLE